MEDSILASKEFEKIAIKGWLKIADLPSNSTRLLYRGTRDGFKTETFLTLCADKGPLIIIIKSSSG